MVLKPLPAHTDTSRESVKFFESAVSRQVTRAVVERWASVRPPRQLVDHNHDRDFAAATIATAIHL